MHAIGADRELRLDRGPSSKRNSTHSSVCASRMHLWPRCIASGFLPHQRLRDHAMQIAAMHGDVRRAVARHRFQTEIEQLPALPGVPQPDRLAGRHDLHRFQRRLQPERMQDAGAVRADLHARAEFPQFRRLLIDFDIDAAAHQRQRRRQPADAAADDRDVVKGMKSAFPRATSEAGSPAASRSKSAKYRRRSAPPDTCAAEFRRAAASPFLSAHGMNPYARSIRSRRRPACHRPGSQQHACIHHRLHKTCHRCYRPRACWSPTANALTDPGATSDLAQTRTTFPVLSAISVPPSRILRLQ